MGTPPADLRAAGCRDMLALALLLLDGRRIGISVPRRSNVLALKRAAQRAVERDAADRERGRRRAISWRAVWKDWCLVVDGRPLTDNRAALARCGITGDGCELGLRSLRADRVTAGRERKRRKEAARVAAAVARARAKVFGRRR